MGGLPRYMALARIDDPEQTAWLADDLLGGDAPGPLVLLQVGKPSIMAAELGRQLSKLGRRTISLVVKDRPSAQSDATLSRITGACAVWVFADDMLEAFLTVYATQLAFSLRAKARSGVPMFGVGGGALSLGGLLLATRICGSAQYDLVAGLGWAARVFIDANVVGYGDSGVTYAAVDALPGLLSVQLGESGGIRAEGGRIESIGSEPIVILGANGDGTLLSLELAPGKKTTIAPPPFAPFEQGLLPPDTLRALGGQVKAVKAATTLRNQRVAVAPLAPRSQPQQAPLALRQAPPPPETADETVKTDTHARPGGGRYCPMCKKVHGGEPRVELAA